MLYAKTGSPTKVTEMLGYPSVPMLYHWKVKFPELYGREPKKSWTLAPLELKLDAIHRCYEQGERIQSVAEDIGYTVASIRGWYRRYSAKGAVSLMKKHVDTTSRQDGIPSADELEALKAQMRDMQMEIDILKETINVLKKDPGVDQTALRNREKAVIIGALKNKYSLPALLNRLNMPRSSYFYQAKALRGEDKYQELRSRIRTLFHENKERFGYRRIHALLKNQGTILSEKVIRRLMKEEGLAVRAKKRRRYNSYLGEISPAVPNLVNRDFHAVRPNQKWLTDITEFSIKAGKVYLSPIIDCFDGMPVVWSIGTSPNAELANSMLKAAISTLRPNEKPVVHSDRGCHYRWPEWISTMNAAGLKRSMSKKGCSPDNAACEGFFGHLKTEMFYNRNWDNTSIEDFIQEVNQYMNWYRADRIKLSLGGLSPLNYRKKAGVAV